MLAIPIICVVGRSEAGKTTLLEKLIPELKWQGYRVATVKQHAHPGFEMDQPGKDTWRHAQAGSDHVVIAAPGKVASIRRIDHELTLDEIAATISDVDIILAEGYKQAGKPKIEVVRAAQGAQLMCSPEELIAVMSDVAIAFDGPRFDPQDLVGLVDLIEALYPLIPSWSKPT